MTGEGVAELRAHIARLLAERSARREAATIRVTLVVNI
jgi:hypothetical protein